ncbi:hypothetical protein C5167_029467 [Papaver somniferum]|nr:hypothetical protein C5167_029467 [Papaver somniferum]
MFLIIGVRFTKKRVCSKNGSFPFSNVTQTTILERVCYCHICREGQYLCFTIYMIFLVMFKESIILFSFVAQHTCIQGDFKLAR